MHSPAHQQRSKPGRPPQHTRWRHVRLLDRNWARHCRIRSSSLGRVKAAPAVTCPAAGADRPPDLVLRGVEPFFVERVNTMPNAHRRVRYVHLDVYMDMYVDARNVPPRYDGAKRKTKISLACKAFAKSGYTNLSILLIQLDNFRYTDEIVPDCKPLRCRRPSFVGNSPPSARRGPPLVRPLAPRAWCVRPPDRHRTPWIFRSVSSPVLQRR